MSGTLPFACLSTPIPNSHLLFILSHPCSILIGKNFFPRVVPIHDKCSQRHDNFNCQTIWLLDISSDFRAKSFTSCPVSMETEAIVTIRDLDELSHCSLRMASGRVSKHKLHLWPCNQYWVLFTHFHYPCFYLAF
jgi:hypothetical protein